MTDTTTTLVSSLNPSTWQDSVMFTATVVSNDLLVPGPPTGIISFFDGATLLRNQPVDGSGNAAFSTTFLDVPGSPHSITAVYNGDGTFNPSTSVALDQVVNKAQPVATLTFQPAPGGNVKYGDPLEVAIALSVFPPSLPGEFIDWYVDGSFDYTSPNPLASGDDIFFNPSGPTPGPLPPLSLGPHTIEGKYAGDDNLLNCNGSTTITIESNTATAISSLVNPVTFGAVEHLTFTVIVQNFAYFQGIIGPGTAPNGEPMFNGTYTPTGTVEILVNGVSSGSGTLVYVPGTNGRNTTATISVPMPTAGTYTILAVFHPDSTLHPGAEGFEVAFLGSSASLVQVVNPASGGGGPPPPQPPPPPPNPNNPSTEPPPPLIQRQCTQRIDCPGTDSPVLNLSSEAIDFPGFFSMYFGYVDPPMGSIWSSATCVGVAESTISQEDANIAAAREAMLCLTNPDTVFWNTDQSCTYTCADGVHSGAYTTPAHSFQAPTQALADSLANNYACLQATLAAHCTGVGNTAQTCSFTCQSGQTTTFEVPADTFFAIDQASADQLANDFACLEAMFLAFQDPNCGNQPANCAIPPCDNIPFFSNQPQTCSVPCPDGLEFSYTVITGQFVAISQILADRMAYSYACRQAQLNAVCLSALNPAAVCAGTTNVTITVTASGVTSSPVNFWEITAGAVPPGMTFNGGFAGNIVTITGTPSVAGNFGFTIKVIEPNGNFMTKSYSFCVTELLPSVLPDAPINAPYLQDISLNCGGTAAAWFVSSGTLPPGITLDSETGALQGTPTISGTFTFTIRAQLP